MNMKEKLKKILRYRKFFSYNECTVDCLMSMEKDCVQCKGCSFLLLAEKDGSCNICSHALDRVLDEVI